MKVKYTEEECDEYCVKWLVWSCEELRSPKIRAARIFRPTLRQDPYQAGTAGVAVPAEPSVSGGRFACLSGDDIFHKPGLLLSLKIIRLYCKLWQAVVTPLET